MLIKDDLKIKVSIKLIAKIEKILNHKNYDFTKIIFVTDIKIWNANHIYFPKNFLQKFAKVLILDNPQADENFVNIVEKNIGESSLILGFGSGTINDLCKYTAFKNNLNYAIIISALSMNGYSSKNASITINHHKKTLEAKLPIAIFADLTILKNSPIELTKAGLADVLCFFSCLFDLTLNQNIFLKNNNLESINLQKKLVKNFSKNYQKYALNDDNFLRILLKMILSSGYAMTIANSSAPASQAEHLLAHVLTMKYPLQSQNILHGRFIASTTIYALDQQQKLLNKIFRKFSSKQFLENYFNKNPRHKISQYCGIEIANEATKEWDLKKKYLQENSLKIIENLQRNSASIHKKLKNSLFKKADLIKIFEYFEVDFGFENIGFETSQIDEAWQYCKYIRNRFTVADFSIF